MSQLTLLLLTLFIVVLLSTFNMTIEGFQHDDYASGCQLSAVWNPVKESQPIHLSPFCPLKHHSVTFGQYTTQLAGQPFDRTSCPLVGLVPSDQPHPPWKKATQRDVNRVATGHETLFTWEADGLCHRHDVSQ